MGKIDDQAYLQTEQYRDADNLDARVQLHARFSTNKYGWQRWVFDRLDLASECRLLELGSGPCYLWQDNIQRVLPGWEIYLSDFSAGMVEQARHNLGPARQCFHFALIDAQAIPFPNQSLDAVIANHMLYHVPDRPKALAEIRRVLRPGGRFYASTIGEEHLQELDELVGSFALQKSTWIEERRPDYAFLLENGGEQIRACFAHVALYRYEDDLVITEAEPLIAYALSMIDTPLADRARLAAFTQTVEELLRQHGHIYVTKDSGMFEAFG